MLKTGIITTKIASGSYGKIYNLILSDKKYAVKIIKMSSHLNRISAESLHDCYLIYHLCKFWYKYFPYVYELEYFNNELYIIMDKAFCDLHTFIKLEWTNINNNEKIGINTLTTWSSNKFSEKNVRDSLTLSAPGLLQSTKTRDMYLNDFITQIITAIQILHNNLIIHYDIKPLNILVFFINGIFTVKLTDFGMALIYSSIIPNRYTNIKYRTTKLYQCPENIESNAIKKLKNPFKTDLWSLGMTILEYINGTFKLNGTNIINWIYTNSFFDTPTTYSEFKQCIRNGTISGILNPYKFKHIREISDTNADLLQCLLDLNPAKRHIPVEFHIHVRDFNLFLNKEQHIFTHEQYKYIVSFAENCGFEKIIMLHTLHLFGCYRINVFDNWKYIIYACFRLSHIFLNDEIFYEDFVKHSKDAIEATQYEWKIIKYLDCQIFTHEIFNVYKRFLTKNIIDFLTIDYTIFFASLDVWFK